MIKNTINDQLDKAGIIFHPSDIEMDTERAEYFTQALYQDLMALAEDRGEVIGYRPHSNVKITKREMVIPVEKLNQYFGKENQ